MKYLYFIFLSIVISSSVFAGDESKKVTHHFWVEGETSFVSMNLFQFMYKYQPGNTTRFIKKIIHDEYIYTQIFYYAYNNSFGIKHVNKGKEVYNEIIPFSLIQKIYDNLNENDIGTLDAVALTVNKEYIPDSFADIESDESKPQPIKSQKGEYIISITWDPAMNAYMVETKEGIYYSKENPNATMHLVKN